MLPPGEDQLAMFAGGPGSGKPGPSDVHARRSDPASSWLKVSELGKNLSLRRQVMLAALRSHPTPVNDDTLTYQVEQATGRRQQRNVVAKVRGTLETEGWFERLGLRRTSSGRELLHFKLTEEALAVLTSSQRHPFSPVDPA